VEGGGGERETRVNPAARSATVVTALAGSINPLLRAGELVKVQRARGNASAFPGIVSENIYIYIYKSFSVARNAADIGSRREFVGMRV